MQGRPFRSLWPRNVKKGRDTRKQLWLSIVLGIFLAIFFIRQFDAALRPQLIALAETKIRNQLTRIADQAVTQSLAEQGLSYSDMVILKTDQNGETVALSTDTIRLNLLRTRILDDIILQVKSLDSHSLSVPLGTLTGLDLLSALGPDLPIRVISVVSAEGNFRNEFSDAGINQTLHRVMLDITVTVCLLLPGGLTETQISTPLCIAETIIIGQVPQTYLNWSQ